MSGGITATYTKNSNWTYGPRSTTSTTTTLLGTIRITANSSNTAAIIIKNLKIPVGKGSLFKPYSNYNYIYSSNGACNNLPTSQYRAFAYITYTQSGYTYHISQEVQEYDGVEKPGKSGTDFGLFKLDGGQTSPTTFNLSETQQIKLTPGSTIDIGVYNYSGVPKAKTATEDEIKTQVELGGNLYSIIVGPARENQTDIQSWVTFEDDDQKPTLNVSTSSVTYLGSITLTSSDPMSRGRQVNYYYKKGESQANWIQLESGSFTFNEKYDGNYLFSCLCAGQDEPFRSDSVSVNQKTTPKQITDSDITLTTGKTTDKLTVTVRVNGENYEKSNENGYSNYLKFSIEQAHTPSTEWFETHLYEGQNFETTFYFDASAGGNQVTFKLQPSCGNDGQFIGVETKKSCTLDKVQPGEISTFIDTDTTSRLVVYKHESGKKKYAWFKYIISSQQQVPTEISATIDSGGQQQETSDIIYYTFDKEIGKFQRSSSVTNFKTYYLLVDITDYLENSTIDVTMTITVQGGASKQKSLNMSVEKLGQPTSSSIPTDPKYGPIILSDKLNSTINGTKQYIGIYNAILTSLDSGYENINNLTQVSENQVIDKTLLDNFKILEDAYDILNDIATPGLTTGLSFLYEDPCTDELIIAKDMNVLSNAFITRGNVEKPILYVVSSAQDHGVQMVDGEYIIGSDSTVTVITGYANAIAYFMNEIM